MTGSTTQKQSQQYGLLTGKYGHFKHKLPQAVAYACQKHRPSTTHHDATMSYGPAR